MGRPRVGRSRVVPLGPAVTGHQRHRHGEQARACVRNRSRVRPSPSSLLLAAAEAVDPRLPPPLLLVVAEAVGCCWWRKQSTQVRSRIRVGTSESHERGGYLESHERAGYLESHEQLDISRVTSSWISRDAAGCHAGLKKSGCGRRPFRAATSGMQGTSDMQGSGSKRAHRIQDIDVFKQSRRRPARQTRRKHRSLLKAFADMKTSGYKWNRLSGTSSRETHGIDLLRTVAQRGTPASAGRVSRARCLAGAPRMQPSLTMSVFTEGRNMKILARQCTLGLMLA